MKNKFSLLTRSDSYWSGAIGPVLKSKSTFVVLHYFEVRSLVPTVINKKFANSTISKKNQEFKFNMY